MNDISIGEPKFSNPNNAQPQTDQEVMQDMIDKITTSSLAPQIGVDKPPQGDIHNPEAVDMNKTPTATPRKSMRMLMPGQSPEELDKDADQLINDDRYWQMYEKNQNSGRIHVIHGGQGKFIDPSQLTDMMKDGAKVSMPVKAPDGSIWHIPVDRVHEAIKAGGQIHKIQPIEQQEETNKKPANDKPKPKKPASDKKKIFAGAKLD